MADIDKIRPGDKLRLDFEAEVDSVEGTTCFIKLQSGMQCWLPASLVQLADRIPAPKVFQRGEFVRHRSEDYGVGLVIRPDASGSNFSAGPWWWCDWDGCRSGGNPVGMFSVPAVELVEAAREAEAKNG